MFRARLCPMTPRPTTPILYRITPPEPVTARGSSSALPGGNLRQQFLELFYQRCFIIACVFARHEPGKPFAVEALPRSLLMPGIDREEQGAVATGRVQVTRCVSDHEHMRRLVLGLGRHGEVLLLGPHLLTGYCACIACDIVFLPLALQRLAR